MVGYNFYEQHLFPILRISHADKYIRVFVLFLFSWYIERFFLRAVRSIFNSFKFLLSLNKLYFYLIYLLKLS